MSSRKCSFMTLFIIYWILSAIPGYTGDTSYRQHPELMNRIKNLKIIGIIQPNIQIYELAAGGTQEFRDDWSQEGKNNVTNAIIDELRKKHAETKTVVIGKDSEKEFEEIQSLYRAVEFSILQHTYGTHPFLEKQTNFDYTLGPIAKILDTFGSDAILFVRAKDVTSTAGRKALATASVVAGVLIGVVAVPRMGGTFMTVALVDKSGSILWYNTKGGSQYDLQQKDSAVKLTMEVLSSLPMFEK